MSENNKLIIEKFKFEDLPTHSSILIIGPRGSGKSSIIRDLITYRINQNKKAICVISPTEKYDPFYSKILPPDCINTTYEPKILDNMFTRQIMMREKYENQMRNNENKVVVTEVNNENSANDAVQRVDEPVDPSLLLIMDDCLNYKKFAKDESLRKLIFNSRCYKITSVITMQYPMPLYPEIRCNFDAVILVRGYEQEYLEKIYYYYCEMFETYDSFKQVYDVLTENFGAMVIVKHGPNNINGTAQIKWYISAQFENNIVRTVTYKEKQPPQVSLDDTLQLINDENNAVKTVSYKEKQPLQVSLDDTLRLINDEYEMPTCSSLKFCSDGIMNTLRSFF